MGTNVSAYSAARSPKKSGVWVLVLGNTSKSFAPEMKTAGASSLCASSRSHTYYLLPPGYRVSMLHARPETLVFLGALLTGPLDPAGKHQLPHTRPQLQDVTQYPLGIREGRTAVKRFPEARRSGQIFARLSWMGNFPAQPRLRAGIATWVGLGVLRQPEKQTETVGSQRCRRESSAEGTTF